MSTAIQAAVIPEEAHLFFREGNSDKVYSLALAQCETGWTVLASWGRRNSTLTTDVKIERAEYESAKKIYDATLRAKLAKGYQSSSPLPESRATVEAVPSLAGVAPSSLGPALTKARRPVSRDVVFAAELLTRITDQEGMLYARNDRYLFQTKRDGDRLTVAAERLADSNLFECWGYNKLGQVVQLDANLYVALRKLMEIGGFSKIMMDGEWEASGYWVWDLLELDGDLRGMPYRARNEAAVQLLADPSMAQLVRMFHPVETADDTATKLALLEKAKATRAEGIAIKLKSAPYRGGRNGNHLKWKFEVTGSFIVGPKPKNKANDGHRSVALYVIDRGQQRFVATVKIADRYEVPAEGSVIEARYLYAHPKGGIVQPVFFGKVRTDVRPQDCLEQQLKYKQDAEEAAA